MLKRLCCWPTSKVKKAALVLLSTIFIAAGVNHYLKPIMYVSIMPAYLPAHLQLVYVSGFFEILGGLGILICRFRKLAAIGLILLTLAVFPANINMALHPENFSQVGPAWLWVARLPLQFLILAWIYWACLSDDK